MKPKLNFLISSAIATLAFSTPSSIQGTETLSMPNEHIRPSGIQLKEVADGILEAVLGSGNDVLLKISMDLKSLKEPVEREHLEVPVRLFLTDFASSLTFHAPVPLSVKVDCEWTPLTCILSAKPSFFNSYSQFTDWLNQGYFANENRITYDFHVDVHQFAPSLAQYLYAVAPGGYHFTGTYAVHNVKIIPDSCIPNIAYHSQRGSANTTTVTLGGVLYLNKKPYPISDHHQTFPHSIIEQREFKRDQTKKFYYYRWLAHTQITIIETYEELSGNRIGDWPNVPCETYSLLRQKLGDLKEIEHLACWDAITGEAIDIGGEKVFLMEPEGNKEIALGRLESIVTDERGKQFIVRYLYSTPKEESSSESLEKEAERLTIALAARRKAEKAKIEETVKQIENLKKQLEGTQREIDDLRRIVHESGLSERVVKGQLKIRQETEEREYQERVTLWSSGVEIIIQHLKDLQNDNLAWGDLLKILEYMKTFYTKEEQIRRLLSECPSIQWLEAVNSVERCLFIKDAWWLNEESTDYQQMQQIIKAQTFFLFSELTNIPENYAVVPGKGVIRMKMHQIATKLREILNRKMEKYKELQGIQHPHWDEFSRI